MSICQKENSDSTTTRDTINREKIQRPEGIMIEDKCSENVGTVSSTIRIGKRIVPAACTSGNHPLTSNCRNSECIQQEIKDASKSSRRPDSCLSSTSKKVTFKSLEIRSYPIILGDNPNCSHGPPIQIDWEPFRTKKFSIDEYEARRKSRYVVSLMFGI